MQEKSVRDNHPLSPKNCRLLVAGFSTRHVAASACRAGYTVYAVDSFCDKDLYAYVKDARTFTKCDELQDLIALSCREWDIDAILVTSGAETITVSEAPVIGTSAKNAKQFCDKQQVQHFFEKNGFPTPAKINPESFGETGIGTWMLKPCHGAGGWRNRRVFSRQDIDNWTEEFEEPFILQEFVTGIPASVCCVTTGKKAQALAVNGQITRDDPVLEFGFAGSYTPFIHPCTERMITLAEKIALVSGCIGVIGIDFIVGESHVWAIEINPRFQATLETVERATGLNIVQTHIDAYNEIIPLTRPTSHQVSIRKILFADREFTWPQNTKSEKLKNPGEDLTRFSDIPQPGTIFEPGHAMISVYGLGADLKTATSDLHTSITTVLQYIQ
jgi:predicted ATP-grasp superfamily ATP-dependent carboligase